MRSSSCWSSSSWVGASRPECLVSPVAALPNFPSGGSGVCACAGGGVSVRAANATSHTAVRPRTRQVRRRARQQSAMRAKAAAHRKPPSARRFAGRFPPVTSALHPVTRSGNARSASPPGPHEESPPTEELFPARASACWIRCAHRVCAPGVFRGSRGPAGRPAARRCMTTGHCVRFPNPFRANPSASLSPPQSPVRRTRRRRRHRPRTTLDKCRYREQSDGASGKQSHVSRTHVRTVDRSTGSLVREPPRPRRGESVPTIGGTAGVTHLTFPCSVHVPCTSRPTRQKHHAVMHDTPVYALGMITDPQRHSRPPIGGGRRISFL